MLCFVSIFELIQRGNRWLRRPTLAAIKSDANDFGINLIAAMGGFLGAFLDFLSAFSMT